MSLDQTENRFLCFSLGEEQYAIPLLSVREVIAPPEITRVPQTSAHFLGITNLRGQVISIIDMRVKLSIKPGNSSETAVIICDLYPNSIGVIVDSINSVISPTPDQISEKPEIPGSKNTEYIKNVMRVDGKLILLLDIAKTLGAADHQMNAKLVAQAAPKAA